VDNLNEILRVVEKPARYTGGEYNEPQLQISGFNFCMCFPDLYEVGMSNLGIRIVMDAINRNNNMTADRCFTPWIDFGDKLKENKIPLYSLGLKKPLKEFDMLGFSLQYEMCYTNILYMLELAEIPLIKTQRDNSYPLIACGGPCAVNPEPLADFVDIFFIGDGEENVTKTAELFIKYKDNREEFLKQASKVEGVYVPKFMEVIYNEDKTINHFEGVTKVKKALVNDLDKAIFPENMMVANTEAVHDRVVVEVMRGCFRSCRFCQAGFIYRPVRKRKVETISKQSCDLLCGSGFDEISLNSLSTGDYPQLKDLIKTLKKDIPKDVKIALPSLRVDSFDSDFAEEARKSSLTFAPEAGSQRLRNVINKDITEDEVLKGVKAAFESGYFSVKLYFMLGLPTETEEDLAGIKKLAESIQRVYRNIPKRPKALRISISCSTFIPKPFTPFQWERQATKDEVEQKQKFLRDSLRIKNISFSWSRYDVSSLEAAFARGDRRLGKVLLAAYKNGCIFDGWDEKFNAEGWNKAFESENVDKNFYLREIKEDEILPWDFIDIYVDKKFLLKENKLSHSEEVSGNCKNQCKGCGIQKEFKCDFN
jgi:radical SAM family uncharacterized protein